MRLDNKTGYGIFLVSLVLALMLYAAPISGYDETNLTTPYADQSIIDNLISTNSTLNITLKVEYWNATSTAWINAMNVYDGLIDINSTTIALDQYWDSTGWNVSSLPQGYGKYRAYVALMMPNGSVVRTINDTLLMASYNFTYNSPQVNITGMSILPDDDEFTEGAQINPEEDTNITVNITANLSNSTAIDSCLVRIFNESDSYASPTLGPYTGTVSVVDGTTICVASWNMSYWYNIGDWNVSVDVDTLYASANDTTSFFYNVLRSHSVNVTDINISGTPGEIINSSTAYPLGIKNTGNMLLNFSINSEDFVGEDNPSFIIGAGNMTYNDTATGIFSPLTFNYETVFAYVSPQQIKDLYFRGIIPLNLQAQVYSGTIIIRSD